MSLALEIIKNIHGYSRAKYSTWFYYRPDRILFDAGEGVSIAMRNTLYGIENIVISHSHGDHIGGISGLLRSRASSMGDVEKPLTIHYPINDRHIQRLRDYLQCSLGKLPFLITWNGLSPHDTVPLTHNRTLEAFPTRHMENGLSLGYRIIENRTRLKSEYRELSQNALLGKIRDLGKNEVSEIYSKVLLAYTGDTMAIDREYVANAEVLMHDATFVEKSDRDENTHATIEEACVAAKDAKVSCLALFHFSSRYKYHQIKEKIKQIVREQVIEFPVFYIFPPSYPMEFKQIKI